MALALWLHQIRSTENRRVQRSCVVASSISPRPNCLLSWIEGSHFTAAQLVNAHNQWKKQQNETRSDGHRSANECII
eukprot:scaffold46579_cov66-Attheya_sp.AAC.1